MLRDYYTVRIGFDMINKRHTHPTYVKFQSLLFYQECVLLTISYHLEFLCISKVSSMLHLWSMGRVPSRPQISIKKLYCDEKRTKRAKKPAAGEIFFTIE